jgi:phage-related protein
MGSGLERSGVELVVIGADKAVTDLNRFNTALGKLQSESGRGVGLITFNRTMGQVTTSMGKMGGGLQGLLSKFSGAGRQMGAFAQVMGMVSPAAGGAIASTTGLTAALGTLGATAGAVALPLVAATAALAGFAALGARGANLQPTLMAFGNLVGSVTDAGAALEQMRKDTRGTIADFELMRLATSSLVGTNRAFREAVVKDFGLIVDAANRIATATGQSAEVVREKFIRGLRLGSKRLVDDIGVIVDASKAYETYAASIGKSATALTDSEKQTAFAMAAIEQLKTSIGEFGEPIAVLDALKIPLVAITNILDKLGLALQPIFTPFVQGIAALFSALQTGATYLISIFASFAQAVGALITGIASIFRAFFNLVFGGFFRLAGQILPYVVAGFKLFWMGVKAAITGITNIVVGVLNTFASVRDKIFGGLNIDIEKLAFNMARGGGYVIGSFAAGLLRGGTFVVRAVTKIAQIVADFLQGFSPPKTGPLSEIDEGGKNVIRTWADGFIKGFMNPAEQVAEQVNEKLGEIASFSKEQVASRLEALELSIRPFVEQLKIAKAEMEAIAGWVDPALEAVERQRKRALELFAQGKISAEQLRELDEQFEMLTLFKNQQQEIVDSATIQLAIAQSQIATEKALLEIQGERLKGQEAIADLAEDIAKPEVPAKGGTGEKEPKPAKEGAGAGAGAAAGAGEASPAEEPSVPFEGGAAPQILDPAAVQHAMEVLGAGAARGLENSGYHEAVAAFEESTAGLSTQIQRIAESDPIQSIKDKFAGLENVANAPLEALKSAFRGAVSFIEGVLKGLERGVQATFGFITGIVNTFVNIFNTILSMMGTALQNVLGSAGGQRIIRDFQTAWQGLQSVFNGVREVVGGVLTAIYNFFVGKIVNGIIPIIDSLVTIFNNVKEALNSFAGTVSSTFSKAITPIEELITTLGQRLFETLDTVAATIGDKLAPISNAFGSVFGFGEDAAQAVGEGVDIHSAIKSLVAPDGLLGENGAFITGIDAIFAPGGLLDTAIASVPAIFTSMRKNIENAITNLMTWLDLNFVSKFEAGRDAVIGAIQAVIDKFGNFASELGGALSGLGQALVAHFGMPVQDIFNRILTAAESAINLLIDGYNAIPALPDIGHVSFGSVNIFGAAKGGRNLRGWGIVGERGPELIYLPRPADIIPNRESENLLSSLASPRPIPLPPTQREGFGTQNIDRSRIYNNTFNNAGPDEALLTLRMMEAFGRS